MFCPNCGKELEDGSRFCDNCGTPVELAQPVDGHTVIVPELPETELLNEPPMDRPTIIVPELPKTDLPPIPPAPAAEPAPKKNKVGLIIGLIAGGVLLVALTVIICWLIFSNGNGAPEDDPKGTTTTTTTAEDPAGDDAPTAEDLREQLTAHQFNGLTLYLSQDFEEMGRTDTAVNFDIPESSSSASVWVVSGYLSELELEAETSRELADWLIQQEDGEYVSQIGERHDISYVTQQGEGYFVVMGCYVRDGYYWVVQTLSYTEEDVYIDYATLGVVDEDFMPPEPGEEVTEQEISLNGLHLRLDSSFVMEGVSLESVSYSNGSMNLYLYQCPLSDFAGVTTSEDFAKMYLDQRSPEDWVALRSDRSGDFHYVLMTDADGWTTLVGLYVYGDWGWQIIGDTRDLDAHGQALVDYMASGWVVPEEVPELELPAQTVEFADMQLELPGAYKEIYRDNDYVFMSGEMEVYIFTGSVASLDGSYSSAEEMARAEQAMYAAYWDHADWYQMNDVCCLMLWDATENDSTSIAYGYYMVGDRWWMIEVKNSGELDTAAMVGIASSGVLLVDAPATPDRELASRDRIEMTGQLTAEYYGLQVSYSPDWTVDTTWGPTGDYIGDSLEMYSYVYKAADRNVSNAIDFAWQLAEEWSGSWDNCEVGLADGVPYVLLTDDGSDYYQVLGTYANDTDCWEIDVFGYDLDMLEEAIWYATAGQVTEGVSAI